MRFEFKIQVKLRLSEFEIPLFLILCFAQEVADSYSLSANNLRENCRQLYFLDVSKFRQKYNHRSKRGERSLSIISKYLIARLEGR